MTAISGASGMCATPLKDLPEAVQRVAAALQAQGHAHMPQMLDAAARTAQQAADAAVLVVTAGDRRVDEKKVAAQVGKIGRADADFVKARTGFSIGGVAPLA